VFANERIVNFPIPCTNIKTLAAVLEKFEERAAMTMTTSREVTGRIIESPTILFVNYKTKTWTLAEKVTDDSYCVIATGDNIKPYVK
jgi:hypothetical protein